MDATGSGPDKVADSNQGRSRWVLRIRRHPIRLLLPLVLLLLAALALAYVQRAASRDGDYRLELDRRERAATSLAAAAAGAGAGVPSAVQELQSLTTQAAVAFELPSLELGLDVGRNRHDAWVTGRERLSDEWRRMHAAAEQLITAEASVGQLRSDVALFQSLAGRLLVAADELVDVVVELEESPHHIYVTSRQMMLIQRIHTNLHRVLEGGSGVLVAADRIGRDAVLFGDVINGLLHDGPELGLRRVTDEDLRAMLEDLARQFREAAVLIERIIGRADAVQRLRRAVREVEGSSRAAANEVRDLRALHQSFVEARVPSLVHVVVVLGLTIITLVAAMVAMVRDARAVAGDARAQYDERLRLEVEFGSANERADEAEQGLRYLGRSVLQVLEGRSVGRDFDADEIPGPASEIVVALMDWLEAFDQRTKDAATEVAQASAALSEDLRRLDKLSANHQRQVRHVAVTVEEVARSAGKAPNELVELLEKTRELIHDGRSGNELLGDTGSDVERIKESFNESAQSARRVVERSQQLRDIATRIEEWSDHSRMLSLNVTLQANGGDSGERSITTFADELERLAERSRSLVPSVENLAQSVRNEAEDTSKAIKQSLWLLGGAGERVRKAAVAFEATVRLGRRVETLLGALASAHQSQGMQGLQAVRAMTELATLLNQSRGSVEAVVTGTDRLATLFERLASAMERSPIDAQPLGAVVALDEVNVADISPRPLTKKTAQE